MQATSRPPIRIPGRRAAVVGLVALVLALVVPAVREPAHAGVNPPYENVETPYEVEDYYAGFDQPERDGPKILYLHPIGYDGEDWSNQHGQMRIEVEITDPDHHPLELAVTYRIDLGEPIPLLYDVLTGTWHTTIDSTRLQDWAHLLFVRAVDPDGNVTSDGGHFDLHNRPRIENPEGTTWGHVHGLIPVEVIASDGQTPTEQLRVRMGAGRVVSEQGHWEDPEIWTPLQYDAASGRFKGVWNSGEVPDDQHYRLSIEVTDGDGLTQRAARLYIPRNSPRADILPLTPNTDGVETVRFAISNAQGGADGVTSRWRVDSGPWQPTVPDEAYPGGPGYPHPHYRLAAVDTLPLANGTHRLTLDVVDDDTGRRTTVTEDFQVLHRSGFRVAVTSPPNGAGAGGVLTLEAVAWNGALADNPLHPSSIWYRFDDANFDNPGGWTPMQRTDLLEHRFTAQVDLRRVPDGYHTIWIAGTDYAGHGAYWPVGIVVRGSTPMTVTPTAPGAGATVSGAVPIRATVQGGGLAADPPAPVTAWYRVDGGPYRQMATSGSVATATWDSAEVAPGRHTIEIAATDWRFSATSQVSVTVAPRPSLTLSIVAPAAGAGGRRPVAVAARAVSGLRGLSGVSVFARVVGGAWTTLTLGPDGYFRGAVDPGRANVGKQVTIEVTATDYTNVASATRAYTVTG